MKRISVYKLDEGWVAIATTDGTAGALLGPITETPGETFGHVLAELAPDDVVEPIRNDLAGPGTDRDDVGDEWIARRRLGEAAHDAYAHARGIFTARFSNLTDGEREQWMTVAEAIRSR